MAHRLNGAAAWRSWVCAALWALPWAAAAQGSGPMGAKSARGDAVARLVLALRVADEARWQGDALLMISAARLMRSVPAAATGTTTWSSQTLLNEARAMARERPDLQALIEDVQVAGSRAVEDPLPTRTLRLAGRATQRLEMRFGGDDDAAVGLILPDGAATAGADLDLYVHDERGAVVCMSEGPGIPELCRWTPRRAGNFRITVINRRDEAVGFVLVAQ
jgi:hypothetical protein